MKIKLPFTKKKEDPTLEDLQNNYIKAKNKLNSEVGKVSHKHPVGSQLHKYGFAKPKYDEDKKKIKEWVGQEKFEKFQHRYVSTDFPEPEDRYRLVLEQPDFNIENTYYWLYRYLNETWGFNRVEKITDNLSSSVASSNFGNIETRKGAQQSQAAQYLKGVSEMIKGLFQIVRELRVVDQRLQYYYDSDKDPKGEKASAKSSDIVLKGLWIDQVEGGAKNPGSVYGLAQSIGFTVLPDLFFRTYIRKRENIEKTIDSLKFNKKVKEVLKRKMRQYLEWKIRTKGELLQRRRFLIGYLRQHYDVIKLYMSWVKPYLRNIRRLQMYEKHMNDPNIIHAFETQIIEIETLFVRDDFGGSHDPNAVISLHMFFRARPELSYHSYEYQHKGPIYAGMVDITLRAYTWNNHKIENYIKYRNEDDLELISSIDKSVEEAMMALGDELKSYLKEADPTMVFPGDKVVEKHHKKTTNIPDILDPFVSVFKGFGEIAQGFTGSKKPSKKKDDHGGGHDDHGHDDKKMSGKDKFKHHKIHHRAHHYASEAAWEAYYRYKMGPGANIYWIE